MRTSAINKLCCPFDKGDLQLKTITKDLDENVLEGFFTCTKCSRLYPIVKGIPIMNPDEYREYRLEEPLLEKWRPHLNGRKVENFRLQAGNYEEKD